MEIVTSWMEEGIQKGLQQGQQTGRREEAETFVLRLLKRKVGEMEAPVIARITSLSLLQLEELGEALLNFSTLADLTEWLDKLEA